MSETSFSTGTKWVAILLVCLVSGCNNAAQLASLEDLFDREIYDDARVTRADDTRVLQKAKSLLALKTSGIIYRADSVYMCREPKGFKCMLYYADDTLHTTEFEHETVMLGKDLHFVNKTGTEDVRFYLIKEQETHRSGYTKSGGITTLGQRLDIKIGGTAKKGILFSIIKPRGARYYYKYVWVLQTAK